MVLEKTLDSPVDSKIRPVTPKENQPRILIGRTDAEAPILRPPDSKSRLTGKDSDAGKDRREEKGTTGDEMAGWHCRLGGRVLQQTLRGSEGQGAQCAAVRGAAKGRTRLCVNSSTGTTACRNTERRAATRVMQNQAQRKHYTWRGKADSDKRSVLSLIYTESKK